MDSRPHQSILQARLAISSDSSTPARQLAADVAAVPPGTCTQVPGGTSEEKTPLEPSGMSSSPLLMPALQQTVAGDSEGSSKDNTSGTILGETNNPQQSEALHQDFMSNRSKETLSLSKWKDHLPPVLQRPLTTLKTGLGTTAPLYNNAIPHFSSGAFSLSKWKDHLSPALQRPLTTLQKTGLGEQLNFFTSIHFSWLHDRNQQYLVNPYQYHSIMQATRPRTWISGSTAVSPKQLPEKGLLGKHSTMSILPIPTTTEAFCNQLSTLLNNSPADTESHSILQDSGNAVLIDSDEPSSKKGVAAAATLDNTLKTLPSLGSDDRTLSSVPHLQSATAIAVLPTILLHLAWHLIMLCLYLCYPTVAKNLLPTSYRHHLFFKQFVLTLLPHFTRAADHCCTQSMGLQTHQEPHPPPQPPPQPLVLGLSKEATITNFSLIDRDKQHQATPTMASPGSMSRQEPSFSGQDFSSITDARHFCLNSHQRPPQPAQACRRGSSHLEPCSSYHINSYCTHIL